MAGEIEEQKEVLIWVSALDIQRYIHHTTST